MPDGSLTDRVERLEIRVERLDHHCHGEWMLSE
jgi:hypothetical protein